MLSNYKINKTYYVAVMREIPIDHDFILTSETGKIEILSKGIFSIFIPFTILVKSHSFLKWQALVSKPLIFYNAEV